MFDVAPRYTTNPEIDLQQTILRYLRSYAASENGLDSHPPRNQPIALRVLNLAVALLTPPPTPDPAAVPPEALPNILLMSVSSYTDPPSWPEEAALCGKCQRSSGQEGVKATDTRGVGTAAPTETFNTRKKRSRVLTINYCQEWPSLECFECFEEGHFQLRPHRHATPCGETFLES